MTRWTLALAPLFALGCAGGNAPPADYPAGPTERGSAARTLGGEGAAKSAQAPAPMAGADSAEAEEYGAPRAAAPSAAGGDGALAPRSEPSERSRPGLGTEWGETRESHVSSGFFERDDDAPFATLALRYDDREGVLAMARRLGTDVFQARSFPMAGGAVKVRLVDGDGSPLPAVSANGEALVIGEHGTRYSIQVQNQSDERVEVVATVDGLDVIDGRPGSLAKRGYLVAPWATVEIDGFRRSDTEVAAFRFGSVDGSYAGRTGSTRNVGVIGVAVFAEQGSRARHRRDTDRRLGADPFPGRYAAPPPGAW